uniref:Tryptophan synthase beta chain-like PALP domain-containing protein n=1 Tax=Acrobeloides nanus TaxID=290746 RepID=A0A914BXV5_9BILA
MHPCVVVLVEKFSGGITKSNSRKGSLNRKLTVQQLFLGNGNSKESTNVFHEILCQLNDEKVGPPHFFVHSAGTGGTISSVGRYVKKYLIPTEVVLADSEFSIYYDYVVNQRFKREGGEPYWVSPGMAGTGFGYSGPAMHGKTTSLQPSVIDLAFKVPDLASTAAMHFLKKIGISGGTSTGLNFITALSLAAQRRTNSSNNDNDKLRIVVLLADSSTPYEDTYFNFSWISEKFHSHGGIPLLKCWERAIEHSYKHGGDPLKRGSLKCKRSFSDRYRRRHVPL